MDRLTTEPGQSRPDELLADAFGVLDEAWKEHKPRAVFALFSGGHDSLTASAVAFAWAAARGIVVTAAHIATGTGVPQTTQFVRKTCEKQGWPLRVYTPPVTYEALVREYGFPGPGQHGLMYRALKERCLRQLVREAKGEFKDRIMLVTGVRAEESVRRMRHVGRIQRDGAMVWAAAVWNWTKLDCQRHFTALGLDRNPVVDIMHMSGECRCGAFARPGELQEWLEWFPEETAWILRLQEEVEAKGLRGCRWGQRPPRVHREQMSLLAVLDGDRQLDDFGFPVADGPGVLCVGCEEQ